MLSVSEVWSPDNNDKTGRFSCSGGGQVYLTEIDNGQIHLNPFAAASDRNRRLQESCPLKLDKTVGDDESSIPSSLNRRLLSYIPVCVYLLNLSFESTSSPFVDASAAAWSGS